MSTPGPRKFLPPTSSQFKTPKPGFKRPSSSTGPSPGIDQSSSIAPQFGNSSLFVKEDIDDTDGSLDGRSQNHDHSPSHVTSTRRSWRHDDVIYDAETPLGEAGTVWKTPYQQSSKTCDAIYGIEEDDLPPPPASKRLKTTTSWSKRTADHEAIQVSSSSSSSSPPLDNERLLDSEDEAIPPNAQEGRTNIDDSDDDLFPDAPTSPSHYPHLPSTTIPRFKTPVKPSIHYPAKQPPHFKPTPFAISSGTNATATSLSLLPDAFSPSRRRGKREYVAGGFADTVRNWVIELGTDLAAAAAAAAATGSTGKTERNEHVHVREVRRDGGEARWVEVWDGNGRRWFLVSQSPGDVGAVRTGDHIEVDSRGGSWEIDLGTNLVNDRVAEREEGEENHGEERMQEEDKCRRTIHISVLWKKR